MGVFFRRVESTAKTGHDTGRSLDQVVVARVIAARTLERPAESVELAKDQVRIDLLQARRVEPERRQLAVERVDCDDIDPAQQPVEDIAALRSLEVGQQALLAAVGLQAEDNGIPGIEGRRDGIDGDHLGAEARECGPNGRPGDDVGEIEDLEAVEPGASSGLGRLVRRIGHHRIRRGQGPENRIAIGVQTWRRLLAHHPFRIPGQPGHVARLAHGAVFGIFHFEHQPRGEGVLRAQPFLRRAMGTTRHARTPENLLPLEGPSFQKCLFHACGNPVRPSPEQGIGRQRAVGALGPVPHRNVGIEPGDPGRHHLLPQAEDFEALDRMGNVRGADDVEGPAVGAKVGAIEGVEIFLESRVAHVHGLARGTPAFDLALAQGLVTVRIILDEHGVVDQALEQRRGQRHLDRVAPAALLTGIERQGHRRGAQHGGVSRAERQRREGRIDSHEDAV